MVVAVVHEKAACHRQQAVEKVEAVDEGVMTLVVVVEVEVTAVQTDIVLIRLHTLNPPVTYTR